MENKLNPQDWLKNYGDYLYNYALGKISKVELAQDIVQETFLSALKSKDNFKGKSTEKTWLTAILKHKIIDFYRKQSRLCEDNILDSETPFVTDKFMHGSWKESHKPTDWTTDGQESMMNEEFRMILQYCMKLLPEKWRGAFHMKNIENISSEEICKELEISSSNFWVIMHRARLKLRECIEKNWLDK